jgi:hypothetical protein
MKNTQTRPVFKKNTRNSSQITQKRAWQEVSRIECDLWDVIEDFPAPKLAWQVLLCFD